MSYRGTLDEAPASASSLRPKAGPRILILFSDIGEGHASAARTLQDEILTEDPRAEVTLQNGFDALGRFLCWFMRDFYRAQNSSLPRLYRFSYDVFRRVWFFRQLGAFILVLFGGRGVLRLVAGRSPDLVISTDARLNAVLGKLKKTGKLKIPVFATLTDLGGLEFWAHKGVDLHLVMDSTCVATVERLAGKGAARHVRPLVAPAFFSPLSREEARNALELPPDERIVLISGGGWGMGDLEGAAIAALALPGTHAICIAGRNADVKDRLDAAFAGEPRLTVLGFTSRMNELLAACDVVVHAMGGVTYLEATVRDRPVIAYRPPSGHPALIAATLEKQGRQRVAETQEQLSAVLQEAFARPAASGALGAPLPSPASAIFNAPRRVRPRPLWRTVMLRLSLVTASLVVMGSFVFFADASYPVVAKTLHLRTAHPAAQPATIQLVIRAKPDILPEVLADLGAQHATASLALLGTWSPGQVQAVEAADDQVLAALEPSSRTGWMHTRRVLAAQVAGTGAGAATVYLPPKDGLTLSEYLLARSTGAVPLGGTTWLRSRHPVTKTLAAGGIVVLDLDSSGDTALTFLETVLGQLQGEGLSAVPLTPTSSAAETPAGRGTAA
jgi:UDP-N-acetylglucosamine:LPS N-acetylglucosamine transferase